MAINPGLLPNDGAPIAGPSGLATQEWRDFFLLLASGAESSDLADEYLALVERVSALESDSDVATILGRDSVLVIGSLADGTVIITLRGDNPNAGPTWYYGTGPDGVRGFLRLADAFSAGVGIVKTESGYVVLGEVDTVADLPGSGNVGEAYRVLDPEGLYAWDGSAFTLDTAANGVVGFHLAELPDTGIGAALVKTTRDAYGRVEGTEAATTDDLSEGAANLYFPEAPIDGTPYARQDAGWVAAGGGGGSANGGIGVSIGTYSSTADDLPALLEASSIADGGYSLTGEWFMWCYPSGDIEIDVWADSFTNVPTVADSVVGGVAPAIVANTFATGTFPGGPVAIAQTDTLIAHINSASSVKWVKLLLVGTRT